MRLICHCFTLWDLKKIMSLLTLPLTNGNISGPLWQTDLPDKKYFPAPRFLVLDLPQITFRPVSSSRVTPCVLFSASLPNKGLQMMQWRCLTAEPACGWTSLVPVALTVRWARPWSFPTDDLLTSWPWEHLINNSDINGLDNDNIIMTILSLTPPLSVDRMLH